MKIRLVACTAAGVMALTGVAQASDSSLENALKPYKAKLTADIGYLAGYKLPPSSAKAHAALTTLSGVKRDMANVLHVLSAQKASSKNGKAGQALVRQAVLDSAAAASDASAAAHDVQSGKASAARPKYKDEQLAINIAVPDFQQGGKLLHLY